MAFRRASELAPDDAQGQHWRGVYLMLMRRFDEARPVLERAARLDPQSPPILSDLGLLAYYVGDDDGAAQFCGQARAIQPSSGFARRCLDAVFERRGWYRDAFLADPYGLRLAPPAHDITVADLRAMRREQLNRALHRQDPAENYDIALIHARLGERDAALKWLDEGVRRRVFRMPFVNVDAPFDSYRSDPAFQQILVRMGLPADSTRER